MFFRFSFSNKNSLERNTATDKHCAASNTVPSCNGGYDEGYEGWTDEKSKKMTRNTALVITSSTPTSSKYFSKLCESASHRDKKMLTLPRDMAASGWAEFSPLGAYCGTPCRTIPFVHQTKCNDVCNPIHGEGTEGGGQGTYCERLQN